MGLDAMTLTFSMLNFKPAVLLSSFILIKGLFSSSSLPSIKVVSSGAHYSSTYTKIGMIQRRLAWPLHKDDMQIREAFHIFWQKPLQYCKVISLQLIKINK